METEKMRLLGLQDIGPSEAKSTSGGVIAKTITLIGACIYLYNNWNDLIQGIEDGWNGEYEYNQS